MANKIAGLTIEIGGETSGLTKALTGVNKQSKDLQAELKNVDRLLKLDPKNTELLAQKQKLLADSIGATKSKLDTLKEAEKQAQEQFKQGKIGEEQYRAIEREVIATEQSLKKLETSLKETNKNWKETADNLDKFGKKSTEIGKDLSTKVTLPILAAGVASFKFAADLQDAFGATEQIFKSAGGDVKKWADELESYYGIAEGEALNYANIMGAMLQNIGGLTEEEAAKQSQTLVELAGDLTAMFGGTTESAVQALTGALKGNTSMLDNYGMGVNDATIKTKALEMGLYEGTGTMDLASKQAATLALIMEQTADAQGQASKEAEGASGNMRGLVTELKNMATEIGEVLLPIITPFIAKVKEIIEGFGTLSPEMQKTIIIIAGLAAALGPILLIVGQMSIGIGAIIAILPVLGTAFTFLTGPIGIAIAAIAAVIAIGVLLWKNWDTVKAKAIEIGGMVSETFTNLVNGAKEWGTNLVDGLWNGMVGMKDWIIGKVTGFAADIANGFKNFFGIASPSKLMAEYGKNIDEGLAEGISANENIPINGIIALGEKMSEAARKAYLGALEIISAPMGMGEKSSRASSLNDLLKNGTITVQSMKNSGTNILDLIDGGYEKAKDTVNKSAASASVNLNIGTLVADDYSLKQLERKLATVRIGENDRMGVTV